MKTKVCENQIENLKIELFTNGNKNSYQTLKITNTKNGETTEQKAVAPVDFFIVLNSIIYNERLTDVITDTEDTWRATLISGMIEKVNGEN